MLIEQHFHVTDCISDNWAGVDSAWKQKKYHLFFYETDINQLVHIILQHTNTGWNLLNCLLFSKFSITIFT